MNGDLLSGVWTDRPPAPRSPETWALLIGQARRTSLLARLARHCADHGGLDAVPEAPRRHLEGALKLAERQRHEVHWEVDEMARALVPLGVPVVLLKGAAYLLAGLPPARGRVFADVDVLVPRERIDAAEAALFAAGWLSDERDPYNQRYYRQWMHEIPPLRHVQRSTVIDLHHTIAPPTSRFRVDGARLLQRVRPLPDHPGLFVLAPEDMVLHSATHLFQEGEFPHGLRDLLDLRDLLTHFAREPGFWDALLARADELALRVPLHHALWHLQRLFGLVPPAAHAARVRALAPGWLPRTAMAWLLERALRPMHPSCDGPSVALARWMLYVRSHLLRMPPHLALPHLVRKAWMRRFPPEAGASRNREP